MQPIHSGGRAIRHPYFLMLYYFFLSAQMLCRFGTFSLYLFDTLWKNFDYFRCLGQEIWHFCWEELEISYYFLYKSVKMEILIKSVCFKHITSYLYHITILGRGTFHEFFFWIWITWCHVTSHDVILTFFMKSTTKVLTSA